MIKLTALLLLILALSIVTARAQSYGPFPQQPVTAPLSAASSVPSPTVTPLSTSGLSQPPALPAPTPPGPSFGDRMTQCLQSGAAIGYGANDISGYSRACANAP